MTTIANHAFALPMVNHFGQGNSAKEYQSFEIKPDLLAFHNIDMKYVVEPGEFDIMVGNSSRDEDLQKIVLKVV